MTDPEHPADAGDRESACSTPDKWRQMVDRVAADHEGVADNPALAALLAAGIDPRDRANRTADFLLYTEFDIEHAEALAAHFNEAVKRLKARKEEARSALMQL